LLLTYVELRYAVRNNDVHTVNQIWRSMFPLFKATGKRNYAFLSVYVRFVLKHGHRSVVDVVNDRLVSLRGFGGHFIGPDTVTEKINLEGK
jgi:hypothetical protein